MAPRAPDGEESDRRPMSGLGRVLMRSLRPQPVRTTARPANASRSGPHDREGPRQAISRHAPRLGACGGRTKPLAAMAERCWPRSRPAGRRWRSWRPGCPGADSTTSFRAVASSRRRGRTPRVAAFALAAGLAAVVLWHRSRPAPPLYVAVARRDLGPPRPRRARSPGGRRRGGRSSRPRLADGVAPFPPRRFPSALGVAQAQGRRRAR